MYHKQIKSLLICITLIATGALSAAAGKSASYLATSKHLIKFVPQETSDVKKSTEPKLITHDITTYPRWTQEHTDKLDGVNGTEKISRIATYVTGSLTAALFCYVLNNMRIGAKNSLALKIGTGCTAALCLLITAANYSAVQQLRELEGKQKKIPAADITAPLTKEALAFLDNDRDTTSITTNPNTPVVAFYDGSASPRFQIMVKALVKKYSGPFHQKNPELIPQGKHGEFNVELIGCEKLSEIELGTYAKKQADEISEQINAKLSAETRQHLSEQAVLFNAVVKA